MSTDSTQQTDGEMPSEADQLRQEMRQTRVEMHRLRKLVVEHQSPHDPSPGDVARLALHGSGRSAAEFTQDLIGWCNDKEIGPVTDWLEAVYLALRENEQQRRSAA